MGEPEPDGNVCAAAAMSLGCDPTWGGRTIRSSEWRPYQPSIVVTPPFPEYTSGHSTFSAAGPARCSGASPAATNSAVRSPCRRAARASSPEAFPLAT